MKYKETNLYFYKNMSRKDIRMKKQQISVFKENFFSRSAILCEITEK